MRYKVIVGDGKTDPKVVTDINFQNGGIEENGVNGLTNEALLAIVIDRLNGFMGGPFPSEQTGRAYRNCVSALGELHARTEERTQRGVEGKEVA